MSDLQKEYQEFFDKKLEEYGVSSPAQLSEEDKKKFFNEIELEWEEGKGPAKSAASVYDRLDAVSAKLTEVGANKKVQLAAAEAAEAVWAIQAEESYPPRGNPDASPLRRLNKYQKVVATVHNREHNLILDIVESQNSSPKFSAHYGDQFYAHGDTKFNAVKAWAEAHRDHKFGEADKNWKREPVIGMTVSASLLEPGDEVVLTASKQKALVQRYVPFGKYYVFPVDANGNASMSAKLVSADELTQV